jgi:hypothetical protein
MNFISTKKSLTLFALGLFTAGALELTQSEQLM